MRHPLRFFLFIAALLVTSVNAQDTEPQSLPEPPDLTSLQSGWWSYLEKSGEEDDPALRVEPFLADVERQLATLRAENQEVGQSVFRAIRENLSAYVELLGEGDEAVRQLDAPAESYTIDKLLQVAAESRVARAEARQYQVETEREQRILNGVTERRDRSFKRYLEATPGDDRLLAALRLIQDRSALAIARLRIALLNRRYEQAAAYVATVEARVTLASELLPKTISDEQLEKLRDDVREAEAAAATAAEGLQATEISASRLSLDTPEGRSQQRLERQKLIEAQVDHALTRLRWMMSNTLLIWAEIRLGEARETEELQQLSLGAREFIRTVATDEQDWRRDTQDELLAVQTASRDGLNRSARRLLDQRSGTAQATLARLEEMRAVAEDLELLGIVAEDAFVEEVGPFKSWLAVTDRFFRGLLQRVKSIADSTLFTIGETPVAGSDILRVIIILIFAYLLSRLVRHAISRFSHSENAGTQASLYTVGRLSHYTIITIAIIVALTTIGLDFSNLALVAGALSVGIGFGLQSIVSNFVSGLIILFEHSLRVGDYIELDTGLTGTVKAINVRSTLINTNDNIDIVVPNSEFVSARLTNWTLGERVLRVRIPFGVAYGSDKDLVRKAALEAAGDVHYTLKNMRGREPDVWLVDYGDSSLNFLLLVWVNRQGARRPTRTRAAYLWALEDKFREYDIEIPFPQRDLHLRSDSRLEKSEEPLAADDDVEPAAVVD